MKYLPLRLWLILAALFFVFLSARPDSKEEHTLSTFNIEQHREIILQLSNDLRASLAELKDSMNAHQNDSAFEFRDKWIGSRQRFRLLAPFLYHYRPDLAKALNGPPIPTPDEEDEVSVVRPPHGLQVLEQELFQKKSTKDFAKLMGELKKTDIVLQQFSALMKNATLNEEEFWQSIQEELIRYFSLVITQMETPDSRTAFSEGYFYFISLPEIIAGCYPDPSVEEMNFLNQIRAASTNCAAALKSMDIAKQPDFFSLYRQEYSALHEAISKFMFFRLPAYPYESGPVNYLSKTIFDSHAFQKVYFLAGEKSGSNEDKIELGKLLFFDPALSENDQRSCASCHQPQKAFTDGLPNSQGMQHGQMLSRNAPTIINSVFQKKLFHDGRTFTFENQASEVLNNPDEMQTDFSIVPEKIQYSTQYRKMFQQAFSGSEDTVISNGSILKAISAYESSLVGMNSRFDKTIRGEEEALTENEKQGFNIFMGKAKCGTCHFLPLFNGTAPPLFIESEMEVLGVPSTADLSHPKKDTDPGREKIIPMPEYFGAFKTPGVRNSGLTAPYMHNGVFATLEEVVEFYNKGGGVGIGLDIPNQTLESKPLQLDSIEKQNLISFLNSLNDTVNSTSIPDVLPAFDLLKKFSPRKVGGDY